MATDIVVILCTAAPTEAASMAQALVRQRIAACVNIVPVQSTYRWKGELCNDPEHLMIVKTTKEGAGRAVAVIRSMHSAEVPEIIVLPVISGYTPYLDWVRQEIEGTP
ncbi:MAG: divalent-cation tolerance protein CutA [Methanoregula sp.]|jgi:periplasmic divalent cation tolerance protein|uniref:divalent-cation tolerance protein CutA n=1 Tax=Methanoregula sp. TaxID=2052170 RepID=UPI003D0CBD73